MRLRAVARGCCVSNAWPDVRAAEESDIIIDSSIRQRQIKNWGLVRCTIQLEKVKWESVTQRKAAAEQPCSSCA